MKHVASRTCVGCRAVDDPDHLVRLTVRAKVIEPVIVLDDDRKLGGRGAWLHPTAACVEKAVRRRAFHRAFRRQVDSREAVHTIEQMAQQPAVEHK